MAELPLNYGRASLAATYVNPLTTAPQPSHRCHFLSCRGGAFLFTFAVPNGYPHDPPKVKCVTKVYHPNIDLEVSDWRLFSFLVAAAC